MNFVANNIPCIIECTVTHPMCPKRCKLNQKENRRKTIYQDTIFTQSSGFRTLFPSVLFVFTLFICPANLSAFMTCHQDLGGGMIDWAMGRSGG